MKKNHERIGVRISIAGSALLALSAVVMALFAKSQAILLDGLYTFTTLVMAYISLKVIDLLEMPETKKRPFGYMALEPFLNLMKSLIMLTLLIVFLVTNIQELCTGGRRISLDITTLYIFICLAIYAVIISLLRRYRKGTTSNILELEIRNWYIDALITAGIAVSLVAALIIYHMGYRGILPYIDPVIVIVLIAVSLPVPARNVLREVRRLLLVSTENEIETAVRAQLKQVIETYGLIHTHIWGLKSGRTHYLFIYAALRDEQTTIPHLDRIRAAIFKALAQRYPKFWADIMFTDINPEEADPESVYALFEGRPEEKTVQPDHVDRNTR